MSDDNDLALTAEDAAKHMKDKLRDGFVNMIPDEAWEKVIKKEFEEFFVRTRSKVVRDNYGNTKIEYGSVTIFQGAAMEVLEEVAKDYLRNHFNSEEKQAEIAALFEAQLRLALPRLVERWSDGVLDKIVKQFIDNTVQSIAYNITDGMRS